MSLPAAFEFSQSSLQDYVDCQKRFQLRYLQHTAWPAVQAEPVRENERFIQRGARFHHLAQQYLLGIPEERLAQIASKDEDKNLHRWWENFITWLPAQFNGEKHVEVTLSAPLSNYRLRAVFDLIVFDETKKAIIFDWKTGTHRPTRSWLHNRLQTRVYPYLLAEAGAELNQGRPVSAEMIEMVYWFAEPGHEPERFVYATSQYEADRLYLHNLVKQLRTLSSDQFSLTEKEANCRFCVYRSLCNRGIQAGSLASNEGELEYEADSTEQLDFNLEQINEVYF